MSTLKSTILSLITLTLLMVPSATGYAKGNVRNNCPFSIWMWTDRAAPNADSSDELEIRQHTTYEVPYDPVEGGCPEGSNPGGISVKMSKGGPAKYIGGKHIYQLEYAYDCGKIWYNLSHEDGELLVDVERFIEVGKDGECPEMFCAPGNYGCDYGDNGANVKNCDLPKPTWLYLCGDQ